MNNATANPVNLRITVKCATIQNQQHIHSSSWKVLMCWEWDFVILQSASTNPDTHQSVPDMDNNTGHDK